MDALWASLIEGWYPRILLLNLALLIFALLRERAVARSVVRPRNRFTLPLLLTILALTAALRLPAPAQPVVYYDEFYYLSTAQSIAQTGQCIPFVRQGVPPARAAMGELVPPYPPGWPSLLSLVFRQERTFFATAVAVNKWLSILSVLLFFFVGRAVAGDAAGLLCAFLLCLSPAAQKAACGADASSPTLCFCLVALLCLLRLSASPSPRSAAAFSLALAFLVHLRPENFLYVCVLALPAAQALRGRGLSCALWGLAPFLLFAAPDAIILLQGMANPMSAGNFMAVPRPAFENSFESFMGNMEGNLLFFVENRVHPLLLTVLFFFGLPTRRDGALSWKPLLLWSGVFICALAPFPFWDFSMRNTLDGWRFSLHLLVPLVLGASCFLALLLARRRAVFAALLVALFCLNPWVFHDFLASEHPRAGVLRAAGAARAVAGNTPVAVEDPNLFMALTYCGGMNVTLAPVDRGAGFFLFTFREPHRDLWPGRQLDEVMLGGGVAGEYRLFVVRSP